MKKLLTGNLLACVLLFFAVLGSNSSFAQTCNVTLPVDWVECNNSTVVTSSNTNYTPTFSASSGSYLWEITGGPINYSGGTNHTDKYPKINFNAGYVYTVVLHYTNATGTCTDTDTMLVFRDVPIIATPNSTAATDTTVCRETVSIPLTGQVVGPYTSVLWTTDGTGTFSSTNTLSTVYTLSAADKTL